MAKFEIITKKEKKCDKYLCNKYIYLTHNKCMAFKVY